MNERYLSVDVMRGLTVTLMIIVNTPGNGDTTFAPLHHAGWHGFTPTDLVFPTFMFVVGNAMSFSLEKYAAKGSSDFLKKVLKRTALIFLLGFLMYWFPFVHEENGSIAFNPISHTRIMGVLQRIALGYGFASLILYYWKEKGAIWFSIFALLAYWLIMYAFGDYTLEGNAGIKFDKLILGDNHMYHGEGIAFDPEGILSTLPSIVNVIAGYLAGKFIQKKGNSFETIGTLMVYGSLLLLTALTWDMAFPINKKLWTSSFVLYTVGIDLFILSILIFIIDIKQKKKWTYFFEVFGRNTLFVYIVSETAIIFLWIITINGETLGQWAYENIFSAITGAYVGSLLYALSWMLFCWLVGYILDKKKIYIKV
jgi:predicted acyltransferase